MNQAMHAVDISSASKTVQTDHQARLTTEWKNVAIFIVFIDAGKMKREINDEMGETNFIYGRNVKLAEIQCELAHVDRAIPDGRPQYISMVHSARCRLCN